MKSTQFWVRRFLWVTGIVFMILMAAALLRGRALDIALTESLLWALVSSAIFTGARYYQVGPGRRLCAVQRHRRRLAATNSKGQKRATIGRL